jgi:hypothetical protein
MIRFVKKRSDYVAIPIMKTLIEKSLMTNFPLARGIKTRYLKKDLPHSYLPRRNE